MHEFSFLCPVKTFAGINALEHLPFELSAAGASKPMVVQDIKAHSQNLIKPLVKAFGGSGITIGINEPVPNEESEADTDHFIKTLYNRFREKGFDTLMALGGTRAAMAAKALNIAVSFGPEALKKGEISQPMSPLVYLPTGPDAIDGAGATTRFNHRTFTTPFLSPNMVIIDPKLMETCHRSVLLNQCLVCLCVGCEVFTSSPAAPARAYAATIIGLARSALETILASGLKTLPRPKTEAEENPAIQNRVVQAAVMTGYLVSNQAPVLTFSLGRALAEIGNLGPGQIMTILLPTILDSISGPFLDQLYLHLSNEDAFSSVPQPQRAATARHEFRKITHRLFALSQGLFPKTLAEAGLSRSDLDLAAYQVQNTLNLTKEQRASLTRILASAWDGRPVNG